MYWVEAPEANFYLLCGSPPDAVKHLRKKGFITKIKKEGEPCETGPNAILLSDALIQNGQFSNMTEFPVLQMLYLQGMILPNHPNNTGRKPLLIGTETQVHAQMRYITRGNFGLLSRDEMEGCGLSETEIDQLYEIKLQFAFGRLKPAEELLDSLIIDSAQEQSVNGVEISRNAFNIYTFSYQGKEVKVDLNLENDEEYLPPYHLGHHHIKREYFAVLHSGEGDGWDVDRPCMASILFYQGKIYLIDAGPNISYNLKALGISLSEIEGVFHTHAHDDHFAGLTTLTRTEKRFKYFSTPLIKKSVARKLTSLLDIPEERFDHFFDFVELKHNEWNNLEGLEVQPFFSPHPIETNVFYFRVKNRKGEYKSYGHLADTVSMEVLWNMDKKSYHTKLPLEMFRRVKEQYLKQADLKKIDVGGGMIHGIASDFADDPSEKLVLAHTSRPLTDEQRVIGSEAGFGMVDVLIPSHHDYLRPRATEYLQLYFPDAPANELDLLLNAPLKKINAGTQLLKEGTELNCVYLILSGIVEYIEPNVQRKFTYSAGSLVGLYAGFVGEQARATYWAASNLVVLTLPAALYQSFIKRNKLNKHLGALEKHLEVLGSSWLFGEIISFPRLVALAAHTANVKLEKDSELKTDTAELYLLTEGTVQIRNTNGRIQNIGPGAYMGADISFFTTAGSYYYYMATKVEAIKLPVQQLVNIPIAHWKLTETYERRCKLSL